ncbi:MAG: NADH-quinone oxidoreductase subunit E [Prevotellaceae bacterium]|jgi:formate hydrogenlyase subunit 3/multisubunit Na+/H+ antiporter MnhD subunit|nr:NADH-quinone oxidoreductase subunit E [Prevotellaceae bacterium]
MELIFLFCILPLLSIGVFFIPKRDKGVFSLILLAFGVADSFGLLYESCSLNDVYRMQYSIGFLEPVFYVDKLSILFVILLNIVSVTAFWYSKGYLKSYEKKKTATELSLHYAAYFWLYCSMLGVILFRDTMTFLLFWEMMTGATFILVIFEGERKEKLKVAISYLVQMHVCLFVLLAAFSIAETGSYLSGFDAVADYFLQNRNYPLFILFFVGFGIKAGFFPLHTWLPEVHPSASGNVSGFMSGAVIKMGIYGLLRIVSCLPSTVESGDLFTIALIVLSVSGITGVYGIFKASRQKDIKKLLAYSSIENIGIIGLGIGMGITGAYWNEPILSFAGYAGALLHTFNHSMFKSMLFFSAGTLCKSTHTQIMDKMGGTMRAMPYTAMFFLSGAIAICALPPLNGFISEFILYNGLFSLLGDIDPAKAFLLLFVVLFLVLIGGMSIIAFTKAFGISFLGNNRSPEHANVGEHKSLILPLLLPFAMMLTVAFFPFVILDLISGITKDVFGVENIVYYLLISSLRNICIVSSAFIVLIVAVWFLRKHILSKRIVTHAPTWSCGYTSPTPKLQYTAYSFSNNLEKLLIPSKNTETRMEVIAENDLFPIERKYGNEQFMLKKRLIDKFLKEINDKLSKLAIFQTGKIQHYVLFALLFMAIILILSYLNLL